MTVQRARLLIGSVAAGGFWLVSEAPWYVGLSLMALLLWEVARTKVPQERTCSCCGYTQQPSGPHTQ
jgi:hypothetical protein